jgi:hypothetical protein
VFFQKVDVIHFVRPLVPVFGNLGTEFAIAPNDRRAQIVGLDMAVVRARYLAGREVDAPVVDIDDDDSFSVYSCSIHNITFLVGGDSRLALPVVCPRGPDRGRWAGTGQTAQWRLVACMLVEQVNRF